MNKTALATFQATFRNFGKRLIATFGHSEWHLPLLRLLKGGSLAERSKVIGDATTESVIQILSVLSYNIVLKTF